MVDPRVCLAAVSFHNVADAQINTVARRQCGKKVVLNQSQAYGCTLMDVQFALNPSSKHWLKLHTCRKNLTLHRVALILTKGSMIYDSTFDLLL